MQATIIQNENGKLFFQMEIPRFPTEEEALELCRTAIRESATSTFTKVIKEAVEESSQLSISETAQLFGVANKDIHEMIEYKQGHPQKLHCIPHDDKRYRRIRLAEVKRWGLENEDELLLQRIFRFEKKKSK